MKQFNCGEMGGSKPRAKHLIVWLMHVKSSQPHPHFESPSSFSSPSCHLALDIVCISKNVG